MNTQLKLWKRNDKTATRLIWFFSVAVFLVVVSLKYIHVEVDLGVSVHVFATVNAWINGMVAILLVAALYYAKTNQLVKHRNVMLSALLLSVIFLISYVTHHALAGDTVFGDLNHNRNLEDSERALVATWRLPYIILLLTHIFLAAIILPFILFTAYRGLTGQFTKHKKLARITWPIWFYVAISGVLVYLMISPYYV
ncbi:MAG: DUF420 domain-containing protein [Flavobacteriales bacterium]